MVLDAIAAAKTVVPQVIQWRRALHQIPELGLELPQTVAFVTAVLTELGIRYDASYVDGNGIVALIEGQATTSGKVLGIRADMDGLPICEETQHPFKSTNACMHACGHDGHTACLLGVAKLLNEHRDQFNGIVKLIFQPGEEYPGGADPMIKAGALVNPAVTRMVGMHQGLMEPTASKGTICVKDGPMMASMDRFLIEIVGKGYHGAYPEESRDPIVAAGQLICALQTIKSRNIKAVDPAVVSITRVEGGFNQNIIPDKVELEGTVRTFDETLRQSIHHKIEQIATGIAAAMDVSCKVTYDYKYPPVINDELVTAEVRTSLTNLFGTAVVTELPAPKMGGEDYAYYLKQVPGTFLFLNNPGYIDGAFHGHHHPKFDIDEAYFDMGIAAFIQITLDYLQ